MFITTMMPSNVKSAATATVTLLGQLTGRQVAQAQTQRCWWQGARKATCSRIPGWLDSFCILMISDVLCGLVEVQESNYT